MDVERTIQFLTENAAAHDARLAMIEKSVDRLSANQELLQKSQEQTERYLRETQQVLRELGVKTDERISALVVAIARFVERPN